MSDTSAVALATARELSDRWAKQVNATLPVIVTTYDTDSNPVLTLSADASPAAGEKVVVVRVKPMAWPLAEDVFGNAQKKYSHHTIQICTEKNYEGATDNVSDILSPVELLPIICEAAKQGMIVEWYRTANGTVPSTTGMTAANLSATYQDLYWNMLSAR